VTNLSEETMEESGQTARLSALTDARVLVVGAGSYALGINIARLLMDSGAKVVMVEDVGDAVRLVENERPELVIPIVAPRLAIDEVKLEDWAARAHPQPHGWYQQFAGKRGRAPRY
jgi:NAD(P)-dependent dehydrogenase (short-subunit alcohol dehydrogenase family)